MYEIATCDLRLIFKRIVTMIKDTYEGKLYSIKKTIEIKINKEINNLEAEINNLEAEINNLEAEIKKLQP